MKRMVLNIALPSGVTLVGVGIGLQFGPGYGLAAAGGLIIGLTIYFARVAGVTA